jgi:hypothetical protein
MKYFSFAISFIILTAIAGCSMEGSHHVTVLDDNSNEIQDVAVLPLYQSSFGIGIGPDGWGPQSSPKVFTKPFSFSSGEDIAGKQIQGKGIIIPPFIFIGTSKYINRWLFMKKDYAPVTVDGSQIYGRLPIVMIRSNNEENKKYIELLLSKAPGQNELKKIFKAGNVESDIKVDLDMKDVNLLKSIK